MCRNATGASANGQRKRSVRLAALVACVFFITILLFSSLYTLENANHIHDHEGPGGACAACMHAQSAENLLKTLSTALVAAVVAIGGLLGLLSSLQPAQPRFGFSTLVSLKIRLNN
ncbi:MAG: hypothetical protein LBU67_05215 [Oscillospiraceae bacterium]|nr:hypothetical protein [Oscillospiraceae bacterium]